MCVLLRYLWQALEYIYFTLLAFINESVGSGEFTKRIKMTVLAKLDRFAVGRPAFRSGGNISLKKKSGVFFVFER